MALQNETNKIFNWFAGWIIWRVFRSFCQAVSSIAKHLSHYSEGFFYLLIWVKKLKWRAPVVPQFTIFALRVHELFEARHGFAKRRKALRRIIQLSNQSTKLLASFCEAMPCLAKHRSPKSQLWIVSLLLGALKMLLLTLLKISNMLQKFVNIFLAFLMDCSPIFLRKRWKYGKIFTYFLLSSLRRENCVRIKRLKEHTDEARCLCLWQLVWVPPRYIF